MSDDLTVPSTNRQLALRSAVLLAVATISDGRLQSPDEVIAAAQEFAIFLGGDEAAQATTTTATAATATPATTTTRRRRVAVAPEAAAAPPAATPTAAAPVALPAATPSLLAPVATPAAQPAPVAVVAGLKVVSEAFKLLAQSVSREAAADLLVPFKVERLSMLNAEQLQTVYAQIQQKLSPPTAAPAQSIDSLI